MTITEEHKSKAVSTLGTMLDYLGLEASIKVEESGERLILIISSDDAGRIIGRKGQSLNSLQLIINRMLFKADGEFPRMYINIDGYVDQNRDRDKAPRISDEKKEQLEQQALDAAKDVKRWGEDVILPEMQAGERRIIHMSLEEDKEINTVSAGDGRTKEVVISLVK